MPDETPPPPPPDPRKDIVDLKRLRPLSAEAVAAPPKCVKCEGETVQCCDGMLGGHKAWFVPICKPCFDAAQEAPAPEPPPES